MQASAKVHYLVFEVQFSCNRFASQEAEESVFYYNPCYSYNKLVPGSDNKDCTTKNDVAVCRSSKATLFNIGKQSTAEFINEDSTLYIQYTSDMALSTTTTRIQLHCSNNTTGQLTVVRQETYSYTLKLSHKCCCSNACQHSGGGSSLSIGSILLIVFFGLLIVYFVGGMVYNRAVRGSQGVEMIPQYRFWTGLPGVIKDGVVFTLDKCRTTAHGPTTEVQYGSI
jgi:1,2-dihydroxy-3-keto-5-methylthiopentene dioxygenase